MKNDFGLCYAVSASYNVHSDCSSDRQSISDDIYGFLTLYFCHMKHNEGHVQIVS